MAGSESPADLPAWSTTAAHVERVSTTADWPSPMTRDWAFGGATGAGVRVCILASGIERDHPLVGGVERSVYVRTKDDDVVVEEDGEGDVSGHGTACASIVRSLAPECDLVSVRVLGSGLTGSGGALLGGLRWAVEEGVDIVNMSLSTTKKAFASTLHELADQAYFRRTFLVA